MKSSSPSLDWYTQAYICEYNFMIPKRLREIFRLLLSEAWVSVCQVRDYHHTLKTVLKSPWMTGLTLSYNNRDANKSGDERMLKAWDYE